MGQFDAILHKKQVEAALAGEFKHIADNPIQPATLYKHETIAPSSGNPGIPTIPDWTPSTPPAPGFVNYESFTSPQDYESLQGGAPTPDDVSPTRATMDNKKLTASKTRTALRSTLANRRAAMVAGLATTDRRLDPKTGENYSIDPADEDYRAPAPANPKTLLVSKGTVPANTSAKPADFTEYTPPSAESQAKGEAEYAVKKAELTASAEASRKESHLSNSTFENGIWVKPEPYISDADRTANIAQQTERSTLLANEAEINAKEEASGSTIRVKNGMTYDLADREAEEAAAAASGTKRTGGTFFQPKLDKQKRPVFKRGADKETKYTVNGKKYTKTSKTWEPVGKKVAIKEQVAPSTFDADLEGITSGRSKLGKTQEDAIKNGTSYESPIPASPYKSSEEDYRPSSIVSTADELASQDDEPGLATGTEPTNFDPKYKPDADNPEGDAYQSPADQEKNTTEYDPESEEGQEAAETAKYEGVKDTPRDKEEAEREQSVRKAALEYEKKQAKLNKTRGPRKPKRLDASGNVIPEKVDRGPNFETQYEDPYDEEGNLRPDHDIRVSKYPELTTHMKEIPVESDPAPTLNKDEKGNLIGDRQTGYMLPEEEETQSIGEDPDAKGPAGAERARRAQVGTDILKHGVSKQMAGPRTQIVEGSLTRVPKAPPVKPEVSAYPPGLQPRPLRAFEDHSAPGEDAVNYNEVVEKASGVELSDDERFRALAKNRTAGGVKTGVVDASTTATGATAGRNEYQKVSDAARREKFEDKLGDDNVDTRYSEPVNDTAMQIAQREKVITHISDLDNPDIMKGDGMALAKARAYVLHSSGGGVSDEAEDKLDRATGGPRNSYSNTKAILHMHDTFKAEEKFNKSKVPGNGITYSMDGSGINHLDPEKVHFRASNGDYVPLSDINHPEHPLPGGKGTLEGSHIFTGGIPNPAKPGTYIAFEGHEGWHPTPGVTHPTTGKRITVLKKSHIPTGYKHDAEVSRIAIKQGETPHKTRQQLFDGTLSWDTGEDVVPTGATSTKGVSRQRHAETANRLAAALENKKTTDAAAVEQAKIDKENVPVHPKTYPKYLGTEQTVYTKDDKIDGNPIPRRLVGKRIPHPKAGQPHPLAGKPIVTTKVVDRNMTEGVEGTGLRGLTSTGRFTNIDSRETLYPNEKERALRTSSKKGGVTAERETRRKAIEKEKTSTPTMFKPGESVFHPKHGVGTVISHGIDMGGKGTTTAVVEFGEKKKSFTGDNIHTHISDAKGKTTRGQELSRYTPATTPTTVTHTQHGSGSVLGYISNTDGSGKTHVKFDSGSTKAITDNKLKFND